MRLMEEPGGYKAGDGTGRAGEETPRLGGPEVTVSW